MGTSCQTNQLDHPDRVDFADGVSTDFTSDVADKDVMGTCYKANLQVEVTGGDITWTSTVGEWTLDGGQVDFGWSGAGSCKFSCCLNKPSLDASTPFDFLSFQFLPSLFSHLIFFPILSITFLLHFPISISQF